MSATMDLGKLTAGFNAEVAQSALLRNLLAQFGGTITTTKGSFNKGSSISIDPALFPGSGVKEEELTWPQVAALIGHELAHAVLPYGNSASLGSDYVTNPSDPAAGDTRTAVATVRPLTG